MTSLVDNDRPLATLGAPTITRPGPFESFMVVVTVFVLHYGLFVDWTATRGELADVEGNLKLAITQLILMTLAITRVVGSLDAIIRAVKLESALFLFTGLAFVSLFWSVNPAETLTESVTLAVITLYGVYLVLRFTVHDILKLLSITFTIGAVVNIAFVFVYPEFGIGRGDQWSGVFPQKNALGLSATLSIPILLLTAKSVVRYRYVLYGATALCGWFLFRTESKTMWLATVTSVALTVVFQTFRGRRTLRGAVMLAFAGAAAFTVAFATANIALLARWLDKDVSLTGRVPLWESLITIGLERPLLGFGYRAAFGGYFSPIHDVWVDHTWLPPSAHNALIQIWVEVGLIGVVLFGVSYGRAVKRGIHVVNVVPGSIGLWPLTYMATTLVISIAESGVNHDNTGWLLYVVAALAVSLHLKYREDLGLSNRIGEAEAEPGDEFEYPQGSPASPA